MARYYFSITSEQPFDDVDGLQLPDLAAAREEAVAGAAAGNGGIAVRRPLDAVGEAGA